VADDPPPELSADQRRALLGLLADELRRAWDTALVGGAPAGDIAARLEERCRLLRSETCPAAADGLQDVQHRPGDAGEFRAVGE
jgi:hypothetical protein